MTTITWTITQRDRLTANDLITTVHWTCSGTDGTFSGSVYSTCSFDISEVTDPTPYDKVSEADVLNWVWSSGVDKDATEAAVVARIEAQKNPVIATDTTWGV